jgi:hypothetical protein
MIAAIELYGHKLQRLRLIVPGSQNHQRLTTVNSDYHFPCLGKSERELLDLPPPTALSSML